MQVRSDYKKHNFPTGMLLGYLIFAAINMAGIILIGIGVSEKIDFSNETMLGGYWGGMIVYFIVMIIVDSIVMAFIYCTGITIYRGIGFYQIMLVVSLLSLAAYFLLFCIIDLGIPSIERYQCGCFMAALIPLLHMILIRCYLKRCTKCGLVNSISLKNTNVESLGKIAKYQESGGYNKDVEHRGTINGEYFNIKTQQYVPKTKQYVGTYQVNQITEFYCCSVCGNITKRKKKEEKKID